MGNRFSDEKIDYEYAVMKYHEDMKNLMFEYKHAYDHDHRSYSRCGKPGKYAVSHNKYYSQHPAQTQSFKKQHQYIKQTHPEQCHMQPRYA